MNCWVKQIADAMHLVIWENNLCGSSKDYKFKLIAFLMLFLFYEYYYCMVESVVCFNCFKK